MKIENFLPLKILILVTAFSACQKSAAENEQVKSEISPIVSSTLEFTSTLSPQVNSPIRKIDFKNFTYPWTENQGDGNFTLINGKSERVSEEDTEATLQKVEYGDVTDDGEEEAILSIYPWSGGNCSCEMVFIYSLNNKIPKLLWSFDTGDRAKGGFKQAYAEDGRLIIELFGEDNFEDGVWQFDQPKNKPKALCCPVAYTKTRFKWNGEKFVIEGKPELFDYDWRNQNKTTN